MSSFCIPSLAYVDVLTEVTRQFLGATDTVSNILTLLMGFDISRFIHTVELEFLCPICNDVLLDPVVTR